MLDWLYQAVAWVLIQIHAGLSHVFAPDGGLAWGLSIVLLTVCVRLVIFPLFVKQIHASRKMQELQPKVAELRKRYKNDKQRLNQEMMKLYQENGANPLGGCLPLVVQAPIFLSLYRVLTAIAQGRPKYGIGPELMASAQHAKIFGAPLAAHFFSPASQLHGADPILAKVIIGCAVVISATTTFLTVRQSTKRSITTMADNPMAQQQKYLMYMSPLFALFGLSLPIGVLMYWVISNAWSLGQQHFVYRKYPMPGTAGAATGTPTAGGRPPAYSEGDMSRGSGLLGKVKTPAPVPSSTDGTSADAPKIVRRQPVKQPRSKRSGNRKR